MLSTIVSRLKIEVSSFRIAKTIASIALGLIIVIGCIKLIFNEPTIRFVRSEELVYNYIGMKEAHSKFEEKQKHWERELDSIETTLRSELNDFQTVANTLNSSERKRHQQRIADYQRHYEQSSNRLNKEAQEEDAKMTQGVLAQVNSFINDYGKEKGYDVILGTTQMGSLLYGDPDLDITDDVLKALNEHYSFQPTGTNE